MLSQIVLARLLGPGQFGLFALGLTIIQITSIFALFGMHNGVVRFATPYWPENNIKFKSVVFQVLIITLLASSLIGVGLFGFAPALAGYFKNPDLSWVIRLFATGLPFIAGLRVAGASSRISKNMRFSVLSEEIIQPIINLVLILSFYWVGWRLFGAVAADVVSYLIAFLFALYFLRLLYPQAVSAAYKYQPITKAVIVFSLPTVFTGMFTLLINQVDRLFIGYYRPEVEIGIYQAISQTSMVFIVIMHAFNVILTPMIADLFHKNQLKRLDELYKISTKWGLYLSIPVFLIICFASQELIYVVFGVKYLSGTLPLIILTTAQLINVATGAVGFLLIMTGRQNQWLIISSIMLVADVILNLTLTPRYGMVGAAIATGSAVSGLFIIGLLQVKREHGLWPYDRRFVKGIVSALITVLALILLKIVDIPSMGINLIMTIVLSVGVFGVLLWRLGLDREDEEFIGLIRRRLPVLP
jgi:O-antigen/teichoic acid export membrane protein